MLKKIIWVLIILVVPLIIFELIIITPELLEVSRTGMCPGAPTDIPPYPCTVGEYLNRNFSSPFAAIGRMIYACIWFGLVTIGTAVIYAIGRIRQQPPANSQPL